MTPLLLPHFFVGFFSFLVQIYENVSPSCKTLNLPIKWELKKGVFAMLYCVGCRFQDFHSPNLSKIPLSSSIRLSVPSDSLKLFAKECFYEKSRRHYGLRQ